jgi:hypothetical protein
MANIPTTDNQRGYHGAAEMLGVRETRATVASRLLDTPVQYSGAAASRWCCLR